MGSPSIWEMVSSLATALGAIAAAGGIWYVAWQIKLQRTGTTIDLLNLSFEELNNAKQREALRLVYSRAPEDLVLAKLLIPSEREMIETVIAHLTRLGVRLKAARRLAELHDAAYKLFFDIVIRTAQQLQVHLNDQETLRGYRHAPDYDWIAREFKVRQLREQGQLPSTHHLLTLEELLKLSPMKVWTLE